MILTFDIGTTFTRAVLFSEEGPISKVIVPTVFEDEVEITVKTACDCLERKSGLNLINQSGEFLLTTLACSSIGGGMKALAASTVLSLSGKAASLALSHSGSNVVGTVSNDDGLNFSERVKKIVELDPDIILLAGQTESESITPVIETARAVSHAVRLMSPKGKVYVVFAGNSKAQRTVERMLGSDCILEIVPNIMPDDSTLDIYPAVDEIKDMSNRILGEKYQGWKAFLKKLSEPIVPSSLCLLKAAENLSFENKLSVVSCGSSYTELITAYRENLSSPALLKRYSIPLGVGKKALTSFRNLFTEKTALWLQKKIDHEISENIARKRSHFPSLSPGVYETELLHSISSEIIKELNYLDSKEHFKKFDTIYATSFIFSFSQPEKVFETILNCLLPTGFSQIQIDDGYLTNYGLVKLFSENFDIKPVFSSYCPVVSLGFSYSDSGSDLAEIVFSSGGKDVSVSIKSGDLKFIDPGFSEAEITIVPSANVDAGSGQGAPVRKLVKISENGILVDSRGRPVSPFLYGENWFPSLLSWKKNLGLRTLI
ncbi:glutamate mutase L [candidate division WOR-3 bacterium]|nr:glutamate mutase L [candidate division WOR-3 bacterium]